MRSRPYDPNLVANDFALRVARIGFGDIAAVGLAVSYGIWEQVMTLPKSANTVIIVGGVLGASAAFHLSDAGQDDVVLIDRGPIASGTTPQAAGQTGYLRVGRFAAEFGKYCIEFFVFSIAGQRDGGAGASRLADDFAGRAADPFRTLWPAWAGPAFCLRSRWD